MEEQRGRAAEEERRQLEWFHVVGKCKCKVPAPPLLQPFSLLPLLTLSHSSKIGCVKTNHEWHAGRVWVGGACETAD